MYFKVNVDVVIVNTLVNGVVLWFVGLYPGVNGRPNFSQLRKPHNLLIHGSELHTIFWSKDFEALKLRTDRSGSLGIESLRENNQAIAEMFTRSQSNGFIIRKQWSHQHGIDDFCFVLFSGFSKSLVFFLPQLRDRMNQWTESPDFQRIGDIIVKFSPFFKMYTEYVKNFDNAINTINNMYQKNSKFANIMDEIHVSSSLNFPAHKKTSK